MDSLIAAAARAGGDVLGALQPGGAAQRPAGTAGAARRGHMPGRTGPRASASCCRAAHGFGIVKRWPRRAAASSPRPEVALARRELSGSPRARWRPPPRRCAGPRRRANARLARLIAARRWLLLGRLQPAAAALATAQDRRRTRRRADQGPSQGSAAPRWWRSPNGWSAELALRSLHVDVAQAALAPRGRPRPTHRFGELQTGVAGAQALLQRPRRLAAAAAATNHASARVAALRASGALVVDACRHALGVGGAGSTPCAAAGAVRAGAKNLAAAWPGDVAREALIEQVFRTATPTDAPRAAARGNRPAAPAGRAAGGRGTTPRAGCAAAAAGPRVVWIVPPLPSRAGHCRRFAGRRRGLVHVGAGAGDGHQPAPGAAGAGRAATGRPRAGVRPRAMPAALAGAAAGFATILLLPATLPSD